MTGMGGGSLMTPLLVLLFGVKPTTAIGTDIAYAAITKTAGGWRHLKLKTVNMPLVYWMGIGSGRRGGAGGGGLAEGGVGGLDPRPAEAKARRPARRDRLRDPRRLPARRGSGDPAPRPV